jgi:tellurite resistance protein
VVFVGFGFHIRVTGHGALHCQRCGGDREYARCVGRRWLYLCFLPVLPLHRIDEHVQCTTCGTRYRLEVLLLPTSVQMLAALPAATRAAVVTMLRAGDQASAVARARAIETIKQAGAEDYGDTDLSGDLDRDSESELGTVLGRFAIQLMMPAHEWFLATVVRVGLADGQLSPDERTVATQVAAHLGMTPAQAHGVIWMTEESAAAG